MPPSLTDAAAPNRLASLDAYRGFVMICLAANGFGIAQAAKLHPESSFWQQAGYQFEHVPWVGCAFWDLIQPSFMFMVGVALPFSIQKRRAQGDSLRSLTFHTVIRAIVLVLLGIALSSNWQDHTNFTFVNVLTQIGLGYVFVFALAFCPAWVQWLAAFLILSGYWAWFANHPLPTPDADLTRVGIPADWPRLTGFEAHWEKNTNAAADFDVWFLNLFPRPEPFRFNAGGYQTLNFIPSLVTMLLGVMAGTLIRDTASRPRVLFTLIFSGLLALAVGWGLDQFQLCPLVKRIWTPSWTLFSSGWTLLMLAGFYGIMDVAKFQSWAFPLRVAGMNSIALYLMGQLLRPWTKATLNRHFGESWALWAGESWQPIVESCSILLIFWLTIYWFYRQKIFFKL